MSIYYSLVGHISRFNYWSCSSFADWIRRHTNVTTKPNAATHKEWQQWRKENKGKVGYWLAEKGLDILQDTWMFIPDVFRNINHYVNNRWIDKTHYLRTNLKPGQWQEYDTRMLHGLFESFVEFIETSKSLSIINDEGTFDYVGFRKKGARERAMMFLDWEINLNGEHDKSQSSSAKEQKELYVWWKDIRPKRPDPFDESGWTALHNERKSRRSDDDLDVFCEYESPEEEEAFRAANEKLGKIEEEYNNEDEEMMIRLIKIRRGLWT